MTKDDVRWSEKDVQNLAVEVARALAGDFPLIVHVERDDAALLAEIRRMLDARGEVGRCKFSNDGDGSLKHLLTSKELTGRAAPLRDLRGWLKGAKRVTIADPYFIHGDPTSWGWSKLTDSEKTNKANEYAAEVKNVLQNVEELDVFHLPDPPKELATAMRKIAFAGCKTVNKFPTLEIHDRVWIKGREDAQLIGTSFGGIGRKLSFMLTLPTDDRIAFLKELDRIKSA